MRDFKFPVSLALLVSLGVILSCSQQQETARPVAKKKAVAKDSSKNSSNSEEGESKDDEESNTDEKMEEPDTGNTTPPTGMTTPPTGMTTPPGETMNPTNGTMMPNTMEPAAPVVTTATGSVAVNVTYVKPATNGSHYMSGHVRAVWVTREKDGKDVYVRTIESFGKLRSFHLRRWAFFSGKDFIDGFTQATKTFVQNGLKDPQASLTWDLKDIAGKAQDTGKYKMWFELTTGNTNNVSGTQINENVDIGKGYAYYSVPFELKAENSTVEDSKNPVFTQIKIVHTAK